MNGSKIRKEIAKIEIGVKIEEEVKIVPVEGGLHGRGLALVHIQGLVAPAPDLEDEKDLYQEVVAVMDAVVDIVIGVIGLVVAVEVDPAALVVVVVRKDALEEQIEKTAVAVAVVVIIKRVKI